MVFDSFEAMRPLVITDVMLEVFEKSCPDYIVPCQRWNVQIPGKVFELRLKEGCMSIVKTFMKSAPERRRMYVDYTCWLEDTEKLTDLQVTISP